MYNLTVMEQGEHLARRNDILVARGERRTVGGDGANQYQSNGVTVTPLQTTQDIADEVGLSKASVNRRLKVADIAEDVRDKLRDTDIPNARTVGLLGTWG